MCLPLFLLVDSIDFLVPIAMGRQGSSAQAPAVPMVDADNPYYINSGDNPGMMLVSTVLTGAVNYFSWARSMRRALMTKNKAGFVDGAEMPPDAGDDLLSAWQRANGLVLGWINRAVSPDIA
ncbi:hypothetical protein LINPERHAP1_LOCUS19063 [Linum perenne]